MTTTPGTTRGLDCRMVLWVFLAALAFRLGYLAYNQFVLDLPPYWPWQARIAFALAASEFGTIELDQAFGNAYNFSVEETRALWPYIERGLVVVFLLFKWLLGSVAYWHVQALQLVLDAVMVIPVMAIAGRMADRGAAVAAGVVYALFLPQVQLAATPSYDCWLSFAFILSAYACVPLAAPTAAETSLKRLGRAGVLLFALWFVANEMRSAAALLGFGTAGWYWLCAVASRRSLRLTGPHWKVLGTMVAASLLVVAASAAMNSAIRDEASPMRSSLGHAVWGGIGQFANPHGVEDSDQSIIDFYNRETGANLQNGHSVEYNHWLVRRAAQFIEEHPVLYASMVARRAAMILFPNIPTVSPVADYAAFVREPEEAARRAERKAIQSTYGRLSGETITRLWTADPAYVIELGARAVLLVALPFGLIFGLLFAARRDIAFLAALPMAYTLIAFSAIYVTPPIFIAAHVGCLAVTASGWYLAAGEFRAALTRRRAA